MTNIKRTCKVILFLALTAVLCFAVSCALAESVQEHVWDNGTYLEAATCDHGEIWIYKCIIEGCGSTKKVEIGPTNPNAHDWGDWIIDQAPTCTTGGTRHRVCKRVSHHVENGTLPALDHDWGDWVITKNPTCTEPGEKTRTCKRDASHTQKQAIDPLGHDWGDWVDVDGVTCTSGGRQKRVCKRDSSHVEYRDVQPLGHDWGPWTVTKQPTCTEDGEEERVCKRCGKKETRPITKLGHKWDDGVIIKKPTVTEEGIREYTCKNDPSHKKQEKIGRQTIVGTLCAYGFRLKESNLYPNSCDKWYMYTPFDASAEGTQTFEVILADRYIPGTIKLTVRDGYLTVFEPEIKGNTLSYDLKFFTVLNKITDLDQYEPEQLLHLNMTFNQPMNIQDTFGDDRTLVLYLCSRVRATYNNQWDFLNEKLDKYQRIRDNMRWLMDNDLF